MHALQRTAIIIGSVVSCMLILTILVAIDEGSGDRILGNVIGTKSAAHKPTSAYLTPFNRPANYTIPIPKPNVVRGITPKLTPPPDLRYDVVRNVGNVKMDPRTCPNDLAYCYQIIEHQQNRTTFGKNYTATSSYVLPETRVRTFVCVGNDKRCVASATGCYCPQESLPTFSMSNQHGKCTSLTHLCTNSYSALALCNGNLSTCQRKYLSCGCGTTACVAAKNTCVTTSGELTLCDGSIDTCLKKYDSCFCSKDMMIFNKGCESTKHPCQKQGRNETCIGSFEECAMKYDTCTC